MQIVLGVLGLLGLVSMFKDATRGETPLDAGGAKPAPGTPGADPRPGVEGDRDETPVSERRGAA